MNKVAFLFPGQGSQQVGMARELFECDAHFRRLVELGSDLSHYDLKQLCLKGPERTLRCARYLQPLLTAVELSYLRHVEQNGIKADVMVGHSLGEIIALGASGVVSYEDAVRVAHIRGELMDRCASKCNGGMLGVMFVPREKVDELLMEFPSQRIVLANDNAPCQLVLSGDIATLETFARRIHVARLGRCSPIPVAGPWHSSYMEEARRIFVEWVKDVNFESPHTPIVMNATGKPETNSHAIKDYISWQLVRPVFWRQCMEYLLHSGYSLLYEIGPGRVLAGLARVNGFKRGLSVRSIGSLQALEQVVQQRNNDELKSFDI